MGDDESTSEGHCPNVTRCPLYGEFSLEASLRTWQIRYCHADYTQCARYQHQQRGERPPPRLLPNGQMLPGAKKDA